VVDEFRRQLVGEIGRDAVEDAGAEGAAQTITFLP